VPVFLRSYKENVKTYFVCYDKQLNDYPLLKENNWFRYPFYSDYLNNRIGISRYNKLIRNVFQNKIYNIVPFLTRAFGNLVVAPWYNDSINCDVSHDDKKIIREYFAPSKSIMQSVDEDFNGRKSNNNVIVGVHIRRGDYITFRGGRYYYSIKQYNEYLLKLNKYFGNEKVTYFIASDESINIDLLSNGNCFKLTTSSPSHDLYGLSKCDYIVGPPSTFSMWASFVGDVPLAYIHGIENFNTNFRIVRNHKLYDNGDPIVFHMP
jgi:hypothetical protein